MGLGSDEQGWLIPPGGPALAGLVEEVVHPGGRPSPRVLVDRGHLPVGGSEHGPAVEAQHRQLRHLQPQQIWEVLVGFLLPASRPDELIALAQARQTRSTGFVDAMHHAIDEVKAPRRGSGRLEPEQAYYAIDIEEQNRPFAGTLVHLFGNLLTLGTTQARRKRLWWARREALRAQARRHRSR